MCSRTELPAPLGASTGVAAAEPAASRRVRTGFVHGQTASADWVPVQLADRFLRLFISAHLDEPKPTRASGCLIAHHRNRFDGSGASEQLLELGLPNFVREISDIQLPTHEHGLLCRDRDVPGIGLDAGGCRLVARLNFRRNESEVARYA